MELKIEKFAMIWVVVIVVVLIFGCSEKSTGPEPSGEARIEGTVKDTTGTPIDSVAIAVTYDLVPRCCTHTKSSFKKTPLIPKYFALSQNYPNPVSDSLFTTIEYALPKDSRVSLRMYDTEGRTIIILVDGVQNAGYHLIRWDGSGSGVGSGRYKYSMIAVAVSEPDSFYCEKEFFVNGVETAVTDSSGYYYVAPVPLGASVEVTDSAAYWGTYEVTPYVTLIASKSGYIQQRKAVIVTEGQTTICDFTLSKEE